jgi:hypothetical protein
MMNPIFPTNPAKVNTHLLPSEAEFISYRVDSQALTIRAWMPENYSEFSEVDSISNEYNDFYSNHCLYCPRQTSQYLKTTYPNVFAEDGSYDENEAREFFMNARENQTECDVWWDGYTGQHCMEGRGSKPKEDKKISISNMVFDIKLNYKGTPPRFKKVYQGDNAHLRAGYYEEDVIYQTSSFAAANVYSSDQRDETGYIYGKICWGQVSSPANLRGIVSSYFQSNFNNDLLRLARFTENINALKDSIECGNYHKSDHKFLCSGYDCLIMIDADQDVQAFFTMLMAGFTPIPEAPHVMIIPAKTSTIQKEDSVYFGYTTQEDAVGRKWYISSEGYLIGQLDESFVTA